MYLTISTRIALPSSAYEGFGRPDQPQLIHFAGVMTAGNGMELDRLVTMVRPIGYPDLPEEDSFFGIVSFVAATKRGMAPEEVLTWFQSRAKLAYLVIGHDLHTDLDNLAMSAQLLKKRWYRPRRIVSTMYGSLATGLVSPKSANDEAGNTTLVKPTLAECFEKATGEPREGALGVRSDVDAIVKVFHHFRWLLSREEP